MIIKTRGTLMDENSRNQVLQTLFMHSSVRHFTDQEVKIEDEETIIKAAQIASSSCNLQPYAFISVKNEAARKEIASISPGAASVQNAPLLLIVCVDQYKLELAAQKAGVEYYQASFLDSFIMGVADAAIAAQNAALAAESMGYGICYIGALRSDLKKLSTMLNLPEKVFPLFGLAVGIPAKKNPVKPRIPIEGVWHRETYDREAVEKSIEEYDRIMVSSKIYEGRQLPLEDCRIRQEVKKSGDIRYGWIEHTARRISSQRPEDIRADIHDILKEAGFSFD